MKYKALFAIVAASLAGAAIAQTDVSGSAGKGPAVSQRKGAMTIRQASGAGKPHAPRNAHQPTIRPKSRSAGVAKRPYGTTHATISRGAGTGLGKGPARPATR